MNSKKYVSYDDNNNKEIVIIGKIMHTFPQDDSKTHRLANDMQCKCNPRIQQYDNGFLVIHNAFDARELLTDIPYYNPN